MPANSTCYIVFLNFSGCMTVSHMLSHRICSWAAFCIARAVHVYFWHAAVPSWPAVPTIEGCPSMFAVWFAVLKCEWNMWQGFGRHYTWQMITPLSLMPTEGGTCGRARWWHHSGTGRHHWCGNQYQPLGPEGNSGIFAVNMPMVCLKLLSVLEGSKTFCFDFMHNLFRGFPTPHIQ